jgi:Ca2+-binding RTX toxin-like protein
MTSGLYGVDKKIGQGSLPTVLYGAKTMNMISTGTFQSEMKASDKQKNPLVTKLVSAWEQKNSKKARAGGISLMALSLAACGSSDDTSDAVSYTQAQLDTAKLNAKAAALTDAGGTVHATVDAAIATADSAAAVSLALRNAAAEAGVATFDGMSDAAMLTALINSNDAGLADAAVAALGISGISTLAALNTAYDALANPDTLTTGVDSLTAGSGDDVINAGLSGANMTLNSLDTVDGGAGSDTLNVSLNGTITPGSITNVEIINATGSGTAPTINLTNASGYTSIKDVGSTVLTAFNNIKEVSAGLTVSDNAVGTTFAYLASAVTATNDAISLTLSNVTAGVTTITGAVETINVVSNTSANTTTLNGGATTVNISGSADLTLAAASTSMDSSTVVNASSATGKITVTHDHTTAAQGVTITGGSGNDTLTLTGTLAAVDTVVGGAGDDSVVFAAELGDTDTVTGGAGEDTLTGVSAELVALTTANKVTEMEAVTVSDALGGTLKTATIGSDIDTVTLSAGAAASNTITFGAGNATLNLGTDNAATMLVNDTGTGTTDTLTINALKSDDSLSAEDTTVTGYEIVNIVTADAAGDNVSGVFTITGDPDADGVQTAATVNISGPGDLTFDTSDEFNIGAATGAGVINAAAMTGALVMTDAAVGVRTITGGSGNDTIVSDNQVNTLSGGAGNDDITGGTAGDTITGGAGTDTIRGSTAAFGKYDNVDGGAGIDTFIYSDAQFDAAVTIAGGDGVDIVSFSDATAVLDAQYTLKTSIETVTSAATGLSTTLDANAMAAGVQTVTLAGTAAGGIDDALIVTAGFTSALTVNLDTLEAASNNEDNNSVNASAYTGVLTVKETSGAASFNVEDASGDLVITGGTGTSDTFSFKGATIASSAIDEITAIENFVVADDTTTDLTLANANTADGKSLVVDGRAITTTSNTLAVDASAEADGAVTVHGSGGVDTLTGSQSDMGDTLNGYAGADNFVFAAANLTTLDTVNGGAGTDTVKIATGTTIDADFTNVSAVEALSFTGATTATLGTAYSASGSVAVTITTGTNSLTMDAVTTGQTVTNSTGTDTIDASAMTAALTVKATEDGLQSGADTITAGTGSSDTLELTFDGLAIGIDAVTSTNMANVTAFETIKSASDAIAGLTLNDANVASSASLTVDMSANASTLSTVSLVNETNGAITYIGGAGGNTLTMSASSMGDTITGSTGTDALTVAMAQLTAADTINGVSGTDTLSFSDVGVLADADLTGVSNMDTMTLTNGGNTVVLGAEYVGGGFTKINTTGTGADSITLGAGVTTAQTVNIDDDTGTDVINAANASGAITITLDEDVLTDDTLTGGSGSDTLTITFDNEVSIDILTAAEMALVTKIETIKSATNVIGSLALNDANAVSSAIAVDVSANTSAAFTLDASAENDGTVTYTGGGGVDTVTGTATTTSGDTISTGAGADVITGGAGGDTITGGAGADTFTYTATTHSTGTAKDSITDFTSASDKFAITIDNSAKTAAATYDATIQTAQAGTSAVQSNLSGSIGQVIYDTTNSTLVINVNADNLVTTLDYQIDVNAASTAANTVVAGDINFTISGGTNADTIVTGGGADTITTGAGGGTVTAGAGNDTITVGGGTDTIAIAFGGQGADKIASFTGGTDVVDFTGTRDVNDAAGSDLDVDGFLLYDTDAAEVVEDGLLIIDNSGLNTDDAIMAGTVLTEAEIATYLADTTTGGNTASVSMASAGDVAYVIVGSSTNATLAQVTGGADTTIDTADVTIICHFTDITDTGALVATSFADFA